MASPVNSSLIIPGGGENQYFNADQVKSNGWTYDPARAKDILENQLQATKDSDGVYILPDGTRLGPWSARTPQGWTDWQTAINTRYARQSGRPAGRPERFLGFQPLQRTGSLAFA